MRATGIAITERETTKIESSTELSPNKRYQVRRSNSPLGNVLILILILLTLSFPVVLRQLIAILTARVENEVKEERDLFSCFATGKK
jgi:hypothetical protein